MDWLFILIPHTVLKKNKRWGLGEQILIYLLAPGETVNENLVLLNLTESFLHTTWCRPSMPNTEAALQNLPTEEGVLRLQAPLSYSQKLR